MAPQIPSERKSRLYGCTSLLGESMEASILPPLLDEQIHVMSGLHYVKSYKILCAGHNVNYLPT
jgi:hypothetical protein